MPADRRVDDAPLGGTGTVHEVHGGLASRIRGRAGREYLDARFQFLVRVTGSRTSAQAGVVALTFDDGPMPGSTDRVLDLLHLSGVHGTFFCVGRNAERYPALLRRIADGGHAIGSHSFSHPHPRHLTPREVRIEYDTGHAAVEQALGAQVGLFRPPHGHLALTSSRVLRRRRPWLWSRDPEDWRPGTRREHVEAVGGASGSGDVVLLHDWVEQPEGPTALDRSATIDAIPGIVAAVRARGLRFERLTP